MKKSLPNLRFLANICLEKLRKAVINLTQGSESLGCVLNPGDFEQSATHTTNMASSV